MFCKLKERTSERSMQYSRKGSRCMTLQSQSQKDWISASRTILFSRSCIIRVCVLTMVWSLSSLVAGAGAGAGPWRWRWRAAGGPPGRGRRGRWGSGSGSTAAAGAEAERAAREGRPVEEPPAPEMCNDYVYVHSIYFGRKLPYFHAYLI